MSDGAPKSAVELALERLRKKDEAAGVVDRPLSEEQRAAIAEARNYYEAKLAESKILHESKLAAMWDPEARAKLDEEHRRDVDRLQSDRDRKIAAVRQSTG